MASLRESDAEDSLNSALLGILLRRIRFSPNEKCSNLEIGRYAGDPQTLAIIEQVLMKAG